MILKDLLDNGITDVNYHGDGDILSLWNYLPNKITIPLSAHSALMVEYYLGLVKTDDGDYVRYSDSIGNRIISIRILTTIEQALADMIIWLKRYGYIK